MIVIVNSNNIDCCMHLQSARSVGELYRVASEPMYLLLALGHKSVKFGACKICQL